MSLTSIFTSILGGDVSSADGEAAIASHVVTALVGNATLATWNTAAQTAVKSVVTELDGGIDKLRAAFDKFDASNPLVSQATSVGLGLIRSQGLTLPTEDEFVAHIKAAIADVAGALGVTQPAVAAQPAAAAN